MKLNPLLPLGIVHFCLEECKRACLRWAAGGEGGKKAALEPSGDGRTTGGANLAARAEESRGKRWVAAEHGPVSSFAPLAPSMAPPAHRTAIRCIGRIEDVPTGTSHRGKGGRGYPPRLDMNFRVMG
eukprot:751580-Hanusia_phi.AAC.4